MEHVDWSKAHHRTRPQGCRVCVARVGVRGVAAEDEPPAWLEARHSVQLAHPRPAAGFRRDIGRNGMRLARARRRRAELRRVRVLPVHLYRPAALIHTRVQHDVAAVSGCRVLAWSRSTIARKCAAQLGRSVMSIVSLTPVGSSPGTRSGARRAASSAAAAAAARSRWERVRCAAAEPAWSFFFQHCATGRGPSV